MRRLFSIGIFIIGLQGCTIISEDDLQGKITVALKGIDFATFESNDLYYIPNIPMFNATVEGTEDSTIISWPSGIEVIKAPARVSTSSYFVTGGKLTKIVHKDMNGATLRSTQFQYDPQGKLVVRKGQFSDGDNFTDTFTYGTKDIPSVISREETFGGVSSQLLMYYTDSGYYVGSYPYDPAYPFYDRDPGNPNFINGLSVISYSMEYSNQDYFMPGNEDVNGTQNSMVNGKIFPVIFNYRIYFQSGMFDEQLDFNFFSSVSVGNNYDNTVYYNRWYMNENMLFPKTGKLWSILFILDRKIDFEEVIIINQQSGPFASKGYGWKLKYINQYQ